jgi:hypothetical protein
MFNHNIKRNDAMSAHSILAPAVLRSVADVTGKYSDVRGRDERQAYERRLALFSGRGIICLGVAPRRSQWKDPQY